MTCAVPTTWQWALILLGSLMLALYVGAEVSMGGYIYSYFVKLLGHSESEGDYLTSAFWGCIAVRDASAFARVPGERCPPSRPDAAHTARPSACSGHTVRAHGSWGAPWRSRCRSSSPAR